MNVRCPMAIPLAIVSSLCGCEQDRHEGGNSAPPPPAGYRAVVQKDYDDRQEKDALAGKYLVAKKPVELHPPVDWKQDPYQDRSWRYALHTLFALDVLFQRHEQHGDKQALRRARELVLDWIAQNPRGKDGISEFAWYDMAVGIRAAYLAHLLRAGKQAGILSEPQQETLVDALLEHGDYLADDDNYAHGHNHGLYQDAGLYLMARQLPDLPDAADWRELASRRFMETLRDTVQWDEGVHLEHSPAYQFTVTNLVDKLRRRAGIGDERLVDLVDRMRDASGWLVYPDGKTPQLGDTDRVTAPGWARASAGEKTGLKAFFGAGYGVVREGEAYLVLAAGYHGKGHKHADALTFCLFEQGTRIVVDSGKYGYYYQEPGRKYAESSRAHNVLIADGKTFDWRGNPAYGSGLVAAGKAGGWYSLQGENPLIGEGIRHDRRLLYKPGAALVVLDRVRSDRLHTYTRTLHMGPALERVAKDDETAFHKGALRVEVEDCSPQQVDVSRSIVRGRREPEVQGFTFPKKRTWREVDTVIDTVREADDAVLCTLLRVGGKPFEVRKVRFEGTVARLNVLQDGSSMVLVSERSDEAIDLTLRPGPP